MKRAMKALIALSSVTLALAVPSTATAIDVSEPDVVQASETERYQGTKVTASYAACGHVVVEGRDAYAQYIATVGKGKRVTATIWAHDITDLNSTLFSYYGYRLSQDQIDMFIEARNTYTCTL